VWEMYKKAESAFWTAEEIDLAHDTKVRAARGGLRDRWCAYLRGARPATGAFAPARAAAAPLQDWEALKDGERHFISRVLAFFAA
jgi:ribonucleoside-diphosphate reductase beta chain